VRAVHGGGPTVQPAVQPAVRWRPAGSGVALFSEPRRSGQSAILLIIGLLVLVLSLAAGGLVVAIGAAGAVASGPSGALVAAALGTAVGSGMAVLGGRPLWTSSTLAHGELFMARMPLRLGDSAVVQFSQRRRSGAEIAKITATLVLRERVRYSTGRNGHWTDRRDAWSVELEVARPDDPISAGGRLRGAWFVRVPTDKPASFVSEHNALEWLVVISATTVRGRDLDTEFQLPVLPEIVSDGWRELR